MEMCSVFRVQIFGYIGDSRYLKFPLKVECWNACQWQWSHDQWEIDDSSLIIVLQWQQIKSKTPTILQTEEHSNHNT